MGPIKSVLKEELENSVKLEKQYKNAIKNLPIGALMAKERAGRKYYYLQVREGKKINWIYKGKVSKTEIEKYEKAKKMRKKYRNLLSAVKKQVKYLNGALRGKASI